MSKVKRKSDNTKSQKKKSTTKSPTKKTSAFTPKKSSGKSRTTAKQKSSMDRLPFPIVGIGGSAGGLEAFSILLQNLPTDLGMAYVYIQHLSPSHESFLPEIVQRKTEMSVHKVKDEMKLEKDHV